MYHIAELVLTHYASWPPMILEFLVTWQYMKGKNRNFTHENPGKTPRFPKRNWKGPPPSGFSELQWTRSRSNQTSSQPSTPDSEKSQSQQADEVTQTVIRTPNPSHNPLPWEIKRNNLCVNPLNLVLVNRGMFNRQQKQGTIQSRKHVHVGLLSIGAHLIHFDVRQSL